MQFNIQDFYKIVNELDPDLKIIFEELTKNINFLDINLKIINNTCILMYNINLQNLLVKFIIKVVTILTQKAILHYH